MDASPSLPSDAASARVVEPLPRARPPLRQRPALLFLVLGLIFGGAIIAANPPFGGADEPAHFLRAYGMARGEIVPIADAEGRKGIFVPADLATDFNYFSDALYRARADGSTYEAVMSRYFQLRAERRRSGVAAEPVFLLYEGSEAYSPAAYLPYILPAALGRMLGLDFLPLLYLMRIVGLLATTAMAAYAIASARSLQWPLFFIGMLPSALYGRCIVSADGTTLSYALVVIVLCLNVALGQRGRTWERAAWMALCVWAKPPQLAFLALEAMAGPFRSLVSRWRTVAAVIVPGLIVSPLWNVAMSADVAAWRMREGNALPAEHFDPLWKLGFMAEHPLHFPSVLFASLADLPGLGLQLIGILGWLDNPLRPWIYPVLGLLLLALLTDRIGLARGQRAWIAFVALLTAAAYAVAVYLIFFLVWTPIGDAKIAGVQGRYFVVVLPLLAIAASAMINRPALGARILPWAAIAGAVLSGVGSIDAVARTHW